MTRFLRLGALCLCAFIASGCYQAKINVPHADNTDDQTGLPDTFATWSPDAPDVRTHFWTQNKALHLRIQSRSLWLARSIRSGGVTLWLDPQNKKKKRFGLQFRGPLRLTPENATDRSSYRRQGASSTYIDRIHFKEQTHVLTKADKEGSPMDDDLPLVDCQQFFWEDGVWFLDLVFPMGVALDPLGEVMILPGTELAIGFDEKRQRVGGGRPQGMSGKGGGGRSGGGGGRSGGGGGKGSGRSGGMGGQPDGMQGRPSGPKLPPELDAWIQLILPANGIKAPLTSSHE